MKKVDFVSDEKHGRVVTSQSVGVVNSDSWGKEHKVKKAGVFEYKKYFFTLERFKLEQNTFLQHFYSSKRHLVCLFNKIKFFM